MSPIEDVFYDESALLARLSTALRRRSQQVVCIVGSALTVPIPPSRAGVPGVAGIVEMIRDEFSSSESELQRFEHALESTGGKEYQAAFHFLQGSRGQQVANEIVRRAVLAARTTYHLSLNKSLTDAECKFLESEGQNWQLNPGITALGRLISEHPDVFGATVLTTNFDPLLEIAIRRANGSCYKTILHADGSLSQTQAEGCHVVHLHGSWYGSDTLHTRRQLIQDRPRLRTSLSGLLRDKVVLVCGYGGWDDVLTNTLLDLVRDDTSSIEILWALLNTSKPKAISETLLEFGVNRGRVLFYAGIDCNVFFPRLCEEWSKSSNSRVLKSDLPSNPVRVHAELEQAINEAASSRRVFEGDNEDRPPRADFCIGRDTEFSRLWESDARVIFITGIGGQGKSTLAARYFEVAQEKQRFSPYFWRDCKEEGERFENQIASVIETLSQGTLSGSDLAHLPSSVLIEILIRRLSDISALFVFDNVDHFVNLESGRLTSAADLFISRFLQSPTRSRILFTCRPEIWQGDPGTLSLALDGLTLDSCIELFKARSANADLDDIIDAHDLTNGHAFWLDLLAVQVVRKPEIKLSNLVAEIRAGQGHLPDLTLQSIWSKLHDREMLVLRAMSETLRPETEPEIAEYVSTELNYNKASRALRSLKQLNLVVVKRSSSGGDLHELHPLVRRFVRTRSTGRQRLTIIDAIIRVYNRFRGAHRSELGARPTFTLLQNWTQAAELAIESGSYPQALECLAEANTAFLASAFTREYVRVTRMFLTSCDWIKEHTKLRSFDSVFSSHVNMLSYLGLYGEVDSLLDQFSQTIPETNVRYITYCHLRSHAYWARDDYQEAIKWGEIGYQLQTKSNVDTVEAIEHQLALALRDAGNYEKALPIFLGGRALSEILDVDELDEKGGGVPYGNIGRCLQLMGQLRNALICYQKSALLIEKNVAYQHVFNQGYIRLWIGEILLSLNQRQLGVVFLIAAKSKWDAIMPPRARRLEEMLREIGVLDERPSGIDPRDDPETICLDWIKGRSLQRLLEPRI